MGSWLPVVNGGHAPRVEKVYEPVREKFQELYDKHCDIYDKLEAEKMR